MVVNERATQPLATYNVAADGCVVVRRCDELVAQRLMRSFSVVMLDVLTNNLSQVAFTQRDDARETFEAC